MFRQPTVYKVINDETQLPVNFYTEAGVKIADPIADLAPFDTGHWVDLLGLGKIKRSELLRDVSQVSVAPVAEVRTVTITQVPVVGTEVIGKIRFKSDGAEVQYQPHDDLFSFFYVVKDSAVDTADELAEAITDVIKSSPGWDKLFTSVIDAGGDITLTAKEPGVTFEVYLGDIDYSVVVDTPAVAGVGIYRDVSRFIGEQNIKPYEPDFKRNERPLRSATYKYYRWEGRTPNVATGSSSITGGVKDVEWQYELYVNESLTDLIALLDLITLP